MKKLSKLLGIIGIVIALLIPASLTKAYSGELDPDNRILLPSMIWNGVGTVTVSSQVGDNYELYYEVLDLLDEVGERLTEIEDELTDIDDRYEAKRQEYNEAREAGASQEELDRIKDEGDAIIAEYNELYEEYISLIPDYVDTSWIKSEDDKFEIDLSKFSGEKNFMIWFKLIPEDGDTIYDAIRSKQEGTKKEETAVKSVSLNKTTLALNVGGTETLTATVLPDTATDKSVKWSSDKEDVATVENGKVVAKAEGTATITVETTDGGYKATCKVTVTKKEETKKEESEKSEEETEEKKITVLPKAGSSYLSITVAGMFVIIAAFKFIKYKKMNLK